MLLLIKFEGTVRQHFQEYWCDSAMLSGSVGSQTPSEETQKIQKALAFLAFSF